MVTNSHNWTNSVWTGRFLDPAIGNETYYTVSYRSPEVLARIEVPILKVTPHSAVIKADAIEVDRVVAAGFDIATVFMRPIRIRPAASDPAGDSAG